MVGLGAMSTLFGDRTTQQEDSRRRHLDGELREYRQVDET
jgi:hypothetical protein